MVSILEFTKTVELCLTYILSDIKYTWFCLSVCLSNPILFFLFSMFTGLRLCSTHLGRGKMNRLCFSCNENSCKLSYFEDTRAVVLIFALNVSLDWPIRFETVSAVISLTNFNAQFSLFINNMFVTLLSSTCFEH